MHGAELRPETLQAWNEYVRSADSRMGARLDPGHQFLWTDESPERSARLRRGEILVEAMTGSGTRRVPDGLIHHWVGALFIPDATLESVLAVAHDYDHYKDIYGPKVVDSKLLACGNGQQKYSMLWLNNVLFVNAALRTQYEARDFQVDQRRWYNIAHVTSAQEVESYGKKGERVLPPGQGNGFIWRLQSIVRYEERDGGVYVELEAIGLTRDIPVSLRWLANPLVARLSRSTLATSLGQTREGVAAAARELRALASCGTRGFRGGSLATAEE
jgi:hypothetical protein